MGRRPSGSRTTRTAGFPSPGPKGPARTNNPVRTCAGCGRKASQGELQRFHQEAGTLVAGPGDGRGAYTCRRLQCFERAAAARAFNRILRRTLLVDPDLSRLYTG